MEPIMWITCGYNTMSDFLETNEHQFFQEYETRCMYHFGYEMDNMYYQLFYSKYVFWTQIIDYK